MITHDDLDSLRRGVDLSRQAAKRVMLYMISQKGTDSQKADLLGMLARKGESDQEIAGLLDGMDEMMTPIKHDMEHAIDVCGTGGDGLHTFNISTAAAFVAASAGATIAKHGNRSSSGGFGSADIFGMMGLDVMADPQRAVQSMRRHRICFLFAPKYHPALRHVAGARRLFGQRSVFNLLGPLCNPARVKHQLVGVPQHMIWRMPRILEQRGTKTAMSVSSADGMDELSSTSSNTVVMYRNGEYTQLNITPEALGIPRGHIRSIQVNGAREAFAALVGSISGTSDPAMVHTTAMNAAGALMVSGGARNMDEGFHTCMDAIKSGTARKTLDGFVRDCGDGSVLEGMD